jgi:serine/threonine protein phosphatase PrpC
MSASASDEKLSEIIHASTRKGAKNYNEDSFFRFRSATGKVTVGGVFDGHGGYNGLLASDSCKKESLAYFSANSEACESWSTEQWRKNLRDLFELLHKKIRETLSTDENDGVAKRAVDENGIVRFSNGDPIHGGTTASVTVMAGRTFISANVGDSSVMLVPKQGQQYRFLSVVSYLLACLTSFCWTR